MNVGFIGLGRMGIAMARHVAKAGHTVTAWNRSGLGEPVEGITVVASPGEVFGADVVLSMLSDDAAIRAVVLSSDALERARPGVVHVVMSTISLALADELAARHAAIGIAYVSAPVFGRPDAAAAAQLNIVAAGEPDAIDKARPLFDIIGRRTWVLGREPRQANAVKVAGNMMIAMAIEAMAEAVVLTGTHGVSPDAFFDIVMPALFAGRAYETYSAKIAKSDFETGFSMRLGLKDLGLAAAAAANSGQPLPLLEAVRGQMTRAVEAGMGEKDWSAIADFTQRG